MAFCRLALQSDITCHVLIEVPAYLVLNTLRVTLITKSDLHALGLGTMPDLTPCNLHTPARGPILCQLEDSAKGEHDWVIGYRESCLFVTQQAQDHLTLLCFGEEQVYLFQHRCSARSGAEWALSNLCLVLSVNPNGWRSRTVPSTIPYNRTTSRDHVIF